MTSSPHGPLRVGIGGPVGSGKTALMEALCKRFRDATRISLIPRLYTKRMRDPHPLARCPSGIRAVETGGCPHKAIARMRRSPLGRRRYAAQVPDRDVILLESGDNLAPPQPRAGGPHIYFSTCAGREDPAQGRSRHHPLDCIIKDRPGPHVCSSAGVNTTTQRGVALLFTNLNTARGCCGARFRRTQAGGVIEGSTSYATLRAHKAQPHCAFSANVQCASHMHPTLPMRVAIATATDIKTLEGPRAALSTVILGLCRVSGRAGEKLC